MTWKRCMIAALRLVCVAMVTYVLLRRPPSGPNTTAATVPRADKAPLKKRFRFLGDFESCRWVSGVAQDRSTGRVPGPSSYFIRAYVVLAPAQTRELLDRYEWAEANGESIPSPPYPLGEGFPAIGGAARKSDALMRALPSMTAFNAGTILLQPAEDLLYLDLVAE